jgi:hypothetical protein
MPDDNQIPEVLRLILQEAKRERSPEEEQAAKRLVLGRGTIAEYIAARRLDAAR